MLMNINEDCIDEELLTENPQCLSTAIYKHRRVYLDDTDDEGEHFNLCAVEDGVYLDELSVGPVKMNWKTLSLNEHAAFVD